MARIPTYEIDPVIHDLDMLLGTDYNNQDHTKNFKLSGIADYVIDKLIEPNAVQSCIPVFRNVSDVQGGNAKRITSSIINQNIYPNGTNISIAGTLDAETQISVKGNGGDPGLITLYCDQNSHNVSLRAPGHGAGATYTLELPDNMGVSGQVLTTNGLNKAHWTDGDVNELNIAGDTNTGVVDLDTQTLTISGGTLITTSVIPDGSQNITIQHDSINRTDVDNQTDLQFGDSFEAISILTSDQGGHVENVTTQEYTLPDAPVTSIIAGTNISISPTGGTGNVTVNAANQVPADNITGSGSAGLDAIFSGTSAIASTTYSDATTLPYSSGYVPPTQTLWLGLNNQGGVPRPAKVPKEVVWQMFDGGGNVQGAMQFNQQARLTVGLNGTGAAGQIVINPQSISVNSSDRLAVGGESKFTGRMNIMGGGICISPQPSGVTLDNTSMVIGSGDNDIVSGSDHSMIVGKNNQLSKTATGVGSDHSMAIGQGNVMTDAKNSMAVGISNTMTGTGITGTSAGPGQRSQVIGFNNTLQDTYASFIAGGQNSVGGGTSIGQNHFVLGYNNDIDGVGDQVFAIGNQISVNNEDGESNLYFFGSNLVLDNANWPTPSGGNLNDAMIIGIRNDEDPSYSPSSATGLGSPALIVGSGSSNAGRNTGLIITKKISGSNPGSRIIMEDVVGFDFADDSAAAVAGIPVGGLYHNAGVLRIRRS